MKTNFFQKEKTNHLKKNDIYSKKSNGSFVSPFNLCVDDMEQLILINFEKDPDKFYNIFELQKARNKDGKNLLLVVAYRNDGTADIYHQSGFPFASQATILNDVTFIEKPLADAKFDINDDSVEAFFAFEDKIGREILVKVRERRKHKNKPFFLLAPIGVVSKNPNSLPVYSLYEMSFTKQKNTNIEILIDKRKHKPDTFPLPIDCSKNFFTRYSADTFNIDLNKNFNGPLLPLIPANNKIEDSGITYELVDNIGHYEIKRMTAINKNHQIIIDVSPPIPDIACINDNIHFDGNFTIATDKSTGNIRGKYFLEKRENEIEFQLKPEGGWQPNEKRWILKFLFLVVKVFTEWPKSYVWSAKIKLDSPDRPVMKSSWKRI